MTFQSVQRAELPDGVAVQIRRAILAGVFEVGSSLPSERELAEQFGVNRTTLREALHELEHQGLLQRRQGARCRVLDYRETASGSLVRHLVEDPRTGRLDRKIASATVEAVRILYVGAAELAARRVTDDDRDRLQAALADLEHAAEARDAPQLLVAEQAFNRAVVRASHNIALELTVNDFYRTLDSSERRWRGGVRAAETMIERTQAGEHPPYADLCRAVCEGRADDAARLAKAVMRFQQSLGGTRTSTGAQ